GGADVILIPEIPYKIDSVTHKIKTLRESGRNVALIIVSEAVEMESGEKAQIEDLSGKRRYGGISHYLADRISERTGAETRVTVLGHVQRGGQPSAQDRLLA